jgi:decaprenyl-phosphate phosphoribosyltransferase
MFDLRGYELPKRLQVSHWALAGDWTIGRENVVLDHAGGRIALRFHARDAHLVLSSGERASIPFRVLVDREAPGASRGVDVDEDRLHPRKRFRPIAAGELSVPVAIVMAIVLGLGGLTLGYLVDAALAITLGVYVVIQILYSTVLKHLPVIDLAVVSSGFLLRAIAGGVAVSVPLSQWFLLVAAFGSLFMVAGKRYSELVSVGAEAGTRKSLDRYSTSYLRFVWVLAAVLVVTFYSLWAFENRLNPPLGVPWTAISIAPFTLGMLQYALEVDAGQAGEPEEVVLHDRVLQGLGVIWLATISIAVFA